MAERERATVFSSSQGSPLSPRLNPNAQKEIADTPLTPLRLRCMWRRTLIALNFHATGFTQLQGRRPQI